MKNEEWGKERKHIRNRKITISLLSLKPSVKIIERRSVGRYGTCRTPQEFDCPGVKVPSKELAGSRACKLFAPLREK